MRIIWRSTSATSTSLTLIACLTALSLPLNAQTSTLTCSSDDGSYHYCRANTENTVRLARQLSGPRCQQDYNWGFDYRGIWVDRGCSAQFEYGTAGSSDKAGNAVAAGILGAIIIGAVIANANSKDDDDQAAKRRNYYRDGYRLGQQDWDNDRPPFYMTCLNRYPSEYEHDFASGYDDGYNNRRSQSNHSDFGQDLGPDQDWRNRPATNDPNRGTIHNPGHGISSLETPEKVITCSDDSGNGRHCNAIIAGGVDIVRQRSGSACRQDYSWGVDLTGIWVSHGCRADFVLHGAAADQN